MVCPNGITSLGFLLGAGGVAVSAAATPPCIIEGRSVYVAGDPCGNPAIVTRRIADANSSGMIDILGPITPVEITTTNDVSHIVPFSNESDASPIGAVDDGAPAGGAVPVGRPNSLQAIGGGIEGYMNIVGTANKGSSSVKIASLGVVGGGANLFPLELGPETGLGSPIFLAPIQPLETWSATSGLEASNNTMSVFDARSVHLGFFSTYEFIGLNSSVTSSAAPITVRLTGSTSGDTTAPEEDLCVTYVDPHKHPQNESPLHLQKCDASYLSGAASASRGSSETQLWQYDLTTQELQPMMVVMRSTAKSSSRIAQNTTPSVSASDMVVVETAPPVSGTRPTTTIENGVKKEIGSSLSNQAVRRDEDNKPASRGSKLKLIKSRNPPSPLAQNRNSFAPMPCVNPYTLVFVPKSAAIKQLANKASRPQA